MFYIDYHITAIRWTSVGISIAWTVLLAAAFIYAIFVKKQRDYRLYKPLTHNHTLICILSNKRLLLKGRS